MKNRLSILFYVFLAMTGSLAVNIDHASATSTERVSTASDGTQGDNLSGGDGGPAVSADGRYVAFASEASNLVPGDTNGVQDVFVHDRITNVTERVSIGSNTVQGNDISGSPAISADGRYVAFSSMASNLDGGDSNNTWDIFVHDRINKSTQLISREDVWNNWHDRGSGASFSPAISADGRYVAFTSLASNLVRNDMNGVQDVFVHDRETGVTELVSIDSEKLWWHQGDNPSGGDGGPAVSADGRYVAFTSEASNLVPGDTNGVQDVFVRDRETGVTERVSIGSNNAQGNDGSGWPAISADGRYVAFLSQASNLGGGSSDTVNFFVHDRWTKTTQWVSSAGNEMKGNAKNDGPAISADGRYIAFSSSAHLVPGRYDIGIFVFNRETHVTELVSIASDGTPGNYRSYYPSISADGHKIAFSSQASNLVPGDTNHTGDVFVLDRAVDLAIISEAPPAVVWGGDFDYVLSVTNNDSLTDATGVTITNDFSPWHVIVRSVSIGTCVYGSNGVWRQVTCSLGSVPKGTTSQITMTLQAPSFSSDEVIYNRANVSADQTDPNTANNTATATTAIDNAPILHDQTFSIAENSTNGTVVGWVVAADNDGDRLTFEITAAPSPNPFTIDSAKGILTIADSSKLDYETTPQILLAVEVTDSWGLSDSGIITIALKNVNDAPTAINLSNTAVPENTDTNGGYSIGILSTSDPDADDDTFTYGIAGGADAALFSIAGNQLVLTAGVLDYETKSSYSVTVRSTDAGGLSIDRSFTITVTNLNEPPTSSNKQVTTSEDVIYVFQTADFPFTDEDAGDTLAQVRIMSLPAAGTLDLSGTPVTANQAISSADLGAGRLTFTPAANGNDSPYTSFPFKVSDGKAWSVSAYTITVDVFPVNDPPISNNHLVTTDEDTTYVFQIADFPFSDDDAGDTLTQVQITGLPAAGTLVSNGTPVTVNQVIPSADLGSGLLTFVPAANTNGSQYTTFQFKVHDGTAYSVSAYTMTIDVTPVNDPPFIDAIGDQAMDITQTSITVPVKAGDIDNDPETLLVSAASGNAGLVPDENLILQKGAVDPADPTRINWTLTVTPAAGQWGDTAITVTVSDGIAAPVSTSFILTVNNTYVCNDPIACPDGVEVTPDPDVTVTFSAVTAAGQTTATTGDVDPNNPNACPGDENFMFLGHCYDIHTSAAYTGDVNICLTYKQAWVPPPPFDEASLTFMHMESGTWENRTISVDTVDNIICGTVSSFSWFAIAVDNTPPTFTLNRLEDTLSENHEMVKVATVTDVFDAADPSPDVDIQVTSNQSIDGDWDVRQTGDEWEIRVRAERSGSTDRIYTINVAVTDKSGNQATAMHTVRVQHD